MTQIKQQQQQQRVHPRGGGGASSVMGVHHRSSSNKCSRLLMLGALMALLYGLFAILALSVIGHGAAGGGNGNNHSNNRVDGVGGDGGGTSGSTGRKMMHDEHVLVQPDSGTGTGTSVASSSSLLRRPLPPAVADPLLPQDAASPVGGGGGGNKILGGRAIRRNFGGEQHVAEDANEAAQVDQAGLAAAAARAAADGAVAVTDDGESDANKDDDEEGEYAADDDEVDDDDAADNDDDPDDGRAEAGAEQVDEDAKNGDVGKKVQRRNFVKPAGVEIVDDDDEKSINEEEGNDDAKDDGEAMNEGKVGEAKAIFGRADPEDQDEGRNLIHQARQAKDQATADNSAGTKGRRVLKAYIEPVDQKEWKIKPLPARGTTASALKVREYTEVKSCRHFLEQFPIDEPPTDADPFLPWIHDVFPTADGKFIQFVAQNRRRCQSGKHFGELKKFLQPNVALFQHVPVKRVKNEAETDETVSEPRYRLSTHEDADADGVATRFICRFQPSGAETLSQYNFDYDYHTYRKRYKSTFTEEGFDNHMIWSSQLLFQCPVPLDLIETVKTGSSVVNDYATLFVDLVPIRTPPRYGYPTQFMQPRYKNVPKIGADDEFEFDAEKEWGTEHILPRIEDSGRWENLPICKPSIMTFVDDESDEPNALVPLQIREVGDNSDDDKKRWKTIACAWTSASFFTRGERRHVTDNVRRLREWAEFHLMTGFDHIFIYDNSGAQDDGEANLEPVTSLFQGKITRINWPCKVCNNRPGTGDNKGERSSQYAAESSCRLRFGAHSEWLGSFDIDEYLVPMGGYSSMTDVLSDMDKKGIKILSFQSMRAWPRMNLLEEPKKFVDKKCPEGCFHPKVRDDLTFMQTYNCDQEKPPRKNLMPAEKQIYRPDYVLLHFVHYSTVTKASQLSKEETKRADIDWRRGYKEHAVKIVDEEKEATMLHTKSVVWDQTKKWEKTCKLNKPVCKVGFPFPPGKDRSDGIVRNKDGFTCNCFVNEKIETVWVPKLEETLRHRGEASILVQ